MRNVIFPLTTIKPKKKRFANIINYLNDNKMELAEVELKEIVFSYKQDLLADTYYLLSYIAYTKEDISLAKQYLTNTIQLVPNSLILLASFAQLYSDNNQPNKAIALYHQVHKLFPKEPQILTNLADELIKVEQYGEAYKCFTACSLLLSKLDTIEEVLNHKIVNCLAHLEFIEFAESIENNLLFLFNTEYIEHRLLLKPAVSLLKLKYNVSKPKWPINTITLSNDQLLLSILTLTINTDLVFEKWLMQIRHYLLDKHIRGEKARSSTDLKLIIAIATQNHLNEFIHFISDDEYKLLNKMDETNINKPSPMIKAMYIKSTKQFNSVQDQDTSKLINTLNALIEQDTTEGRLINTAVVKFGNDHESDHKVKNQYEENPYPRWNSLPYHNPIELKAYLQSKLPYVTFTGLPINRHLNVLIAGCGTGKQAITFAQNFPETNILAIDISKTSLSYAKMRSDEYGISNIEFRQMSILDVHKLNTKFDVIECCGVLHHMESPEGAFALLAKQLTNKGIFKVSIYSQIARKSIQVFREISKGEINVNYKSIIEKRNELISSNLWTKINDLANFNDFYYTSGVRDLLFHEREVQLNIDWISDSIKSSKLEFAGFEFRESSIISKFSLLNPGINNLTKLSLWKIFEQKNQKTFSNMYTFWCGKSILIKSIEN